MTTLVRLSLLFAAALLAAAAPVAAQAVSVFDARAQIALNLVGLASPDPFADGSDLFFNPVGSGAFVDETSGVAFGSARLLDLTAAAGAADNAVASGPLPDPLVSAEARVAGAAAPIGTAAGAPVAEAFLDIDNRSETRSYTLSFMLEASGNASAAAAGPSARASAFAFVELGSLIDGVLFSGFAQASAPQGPAMDGFGTSIPFTLLLGPGDAAFLDVFAVAGGQATVVPLPSGFALALTSALIWSLVAWRRWRAQR